MLKLKVLKKFKEAFNAIKMKKVFKLYEGKILKIKKNLC